MHQLTPLALLQKQTGAAAAAAAAASSAALTGVSAGLALGDAPEDNASAEEGGEESAVGEIHIEQEGVAAIEASS